MRHGAEVDVWSMGICLLELLHLLVCSQRAGASVVAATEPESAAGVGGVLGESLSFQTTSAAADSATCADGPTAQFAVTNASWPAEKEVPQYQSDTEAGRGLVVEAAHVASEPCTSAPRNCSADSSGDVPDTPLPTSRVLVPMTTATKLGYELSSSLLMQSAVRSPCHGDAPSATAVHAASAAPATSAAAVLQDEDTRARQTDAGTRFDNIMTGVKRRRADVAAVPEDEATGGASTHCRTLFMSPPAALADGKHGSHLPSPESSTLLASEGARRLAHVRRTWPGHLGFDSSSDEEGGGVGDAEGCALRLASPKLWARSSHQTSAPAAADAQVLHAALSAQVVSVNAAEGEMEALSNLGAMLGEPCVELWPGVTRIRSFWAMSTHCACCAAREQQKSGAAEAAWLAEVYALPATLRAFAESSTCMRLQHSKQPPLACALSLAPVSGSSSCKASTPEPSVDATVPNAPLVHVHAVLQTYKWLGLHELDASRLPYSVLDTCMQGIELACRMLAVDPARRINAAAAAQHPFCSGTSLTGSTVPPTAQQPHSSLEPDKMIPYALQCVGTKRSRPSASPLRDAAVRAASPDTHAGREASPPLATAATRTSGTASTACATGAVADVLSWVKAWETQSSLVKAAVKDFAEGSPSGYVCSGGGGGVGLFGDVDSPHASAHGWRRPFQMFGGDSPSYQAPDGGARVLRFQ